MAADPVHASETVRLRKAAAGAHRRGEPGEAERLSRQALALDPDDVDSLLLLALLLRRQGRSAEALDLYDRAVASAPRHAGAWAARAEFLGELRRWAEALASAETALAIDPRHWGALHARGNALMGAGRLPEAAAAYRSTLEVAPRFAGAARNLGKALLDLGDAAAALEAYDKAVELAPADAGTHMARGHVLAALGRWGEAAAAFAQVQALDPARPFAAGVRVHALLRACVWDGLDAALADLAARIDQGQPASAPFYLVSTPVGPARQLANARAYVRHALPAVEKTSFDGAARAPGRIRIGYYSADFHDHATAHLTAELFELHDRSDFEIVGVSYGPSVDDPMRRRLKAGFDRFFDVAGLGDGEIVELSRALSLDIAVDLKGFIGGYRPGLFPARLAPVQVNFLGFPGTMTGDFMDYIVADPVVIPAGDERFYGEKVARLAGAYQPNDRRRAIAPQATSRAEHGLPRGAFVFADFNAAYKITPDVFAVWMRLLAQTPGAVLWLLGNAAAEAGLRREAARAGIDAGRMIFAPPRPPARHLERLRHADLFLDTFHCNAHTTASDALWAGLPVLTRCGDTFASRVAASLLTSAGLPELIAEDVAAYEASALALAHDPPRLAALRERLVRTRLTSRLFDTPLFAAEIEALYRQMHVRRMAGLPPDHLSI